MTTYTPVQPLTMLDKMSDFYWNNRDKCDAALFLSVVGLVVTLLVAAA